MKSTRTTIPARLDRLPWSRWHTGLVLALGITWLLDGLEGGIGGSLSGALKSSHTLGLTDAQLGLSSSFYLAGTVLGALLFGYLADRFGRRKLFFWTLLVYVTATSFTALSWNLTTFTFCRALTGAGIGGEYAAINSAIDELIPARIRGRVDLLIGSTFWLGVMLGSLVSVAFLSDRMFGLQHGWRLAFLAGLPIVAVVLVLRRKVPESPRWLLNHGHTESAESLMEHIEARAYRKVSVPSATAETVQVFATTGDTVAGVFRLFRKPYQSRTVLCLGVMMAQSFFYNSVFFSITLVLLKFYGVTAQRVGYIFLPIAFANFLGPALFGHLFDTVGRRWMGASVFTCAGLSLFLTSWLMYRERLSVTGQVVGWSISFLFAAAAVGSAYLQVGEVFPQDLRATSIAFFYAFGTLIGGVAGPGVFGYLIGSGSRQGLFLGYSAAAAGMVLAGLAQGRWGISAERKSLESLNLFVTMPVEQSAAASSA